MKNQDLENKNKINSRHSGLYNNLTKKIIRCIKLIVCLFAIISLPQNLYAAQLDSKGTDFWLMFNNNSEAGTPTHIIYYWRYRHYRYGLYPGTGFYISIYSNPRSRYFSYHSSLCPSYSF